MKKTFTRKELVREILRDCRSDVLRYNDTTNVYARDYIEHTCYARLCTAFSIRLFRLEQFNYLREILNV